MDASENSLTVNPTRCDRCGELNLCSGLGVLSHDVPYDHPNFGKLFRCPNLPPDSDEERQARLRRISNLEAFADKRFENFMAPIKGVGRPANVSLQRALSNACEFAERPEGWLVLSGRIGSGKTHLAAAVGNSRLEKGDVVLFITAPDLLDHLRSTFGPSSEIGYDEQFERIRNAQLLVLDDLGAENPSPWAGEKLYQLLNHRHSQNLATVITTNVDLDTMEGRIRSRLLDEAIIRHVEISAPDYRTPALPRELQLTWPNSLEAYADKRFDNFVVPRKGIGQPENVSLQRALSNARDFADHPEGWLVLSGRIGSGKTHLAAAVGNERLAHGDIVLFTTAPDLLDYLRSTYGLSSKTGYDEQYDRIRSAQLLVLDDLGSENPSPWADAKLYQLLNHRHSQSLPTVITTNVDMDALEGRIRSRMLDEAVIRHVDISAPDYRTPSPPRELQFTWPNSLEAYADKRFDNFVVPRKGIGQPENVSLQRALSNARDFAGHPEGWLVLSGRIGSGKTHLAAAVGNERLAHGDFVLFVTAPDLLDHLRSTYGPSSETGYDEQFDRIRSAQLLVLDDLGAENPSPWAGEKLYQLLNHRHSHRLPTVISTNVDLDALENRIRSRLLDEAIIRHVEITAPDYRTPAAHKGLQLTWPNEMRLENFDAGLGSSPKEQKNLATALQIAYNFAEDPDKWLIFTGGFGCGKTHLAAAIARHQYERGKKVAFSTVPDLMDWLRVSFDNSASISFQQRFHLVRNAPLLILDGLSASQGTPWVREKLFQLIDSRYNNELPTVFTTANQIDELDERIAIRLIDRRRCHIFAITARAYAERLGQPGQSR